MPEVDSDAPITIDRSSAFVSALVTEHFVLQSVRSTTVAEASSRSSLYLTTLSSALVAFGFLASTPFARGFLTAIVPVIVLLGLFTYERLVQTSLEDVVALASMQRIRGWYATLLPEADEYFPRPGSDGAPNELLDIGQRRTWRAAFFTMSTAIGVVNSIVAGTGISLLASNTVDGATPEQLIILGGLSAICFSALHLIYQEVRYARILPLSRHNATAPTKRPFRGAK